jgi:predicted NBD/HSP70 family sugar kinase
VTAPVLAADVGGTQMRAALVAADGRVLVRRMAPTPAHAEVPAALLHLVAEVGTDHAHGTATRAVIGLPGVVDYEADRLLWAPHLPDSWPGSLSGAQISDQLGLPAHVANDADLAALGEAVFGAGAAGTDVAFLTVSTGIGAGVVHARTLLRGRLSLGELGHSVIDWQAWHAGEPGTLEELASGSGLARLAGEAGLHPADARAVEEAAAAGDPRARRIWDGAVAAAAAGVHNLVMAFSPDTVVIGGGIGRLPSFFDPMRAAVLAHPEHQPAGLAVVPSGLGDDAGLAGAAAFEADPGA